MQLAAYHTRLARGAPLAARAAPAGARLSPAPRPAARRLLAARAVPEHEQEAGAGLDHRHRSVADLSDEESYLPSDAEADIPMSQRLTARDTFRRMANLPPEYPPEPTPDSPDAHRTVAQMVSDSEEELPDDPLDLDEEIIQDTKPFIQDVYNSMAGVRRKARNAEASTTSSRGPEDSPKSHPAGPSISNQPPGGASHMSVGGGGDKSEPGAEGREARMAAAEHDVTDMHHGEGQAHSQHLEAPPGQTEGSPKDWPGPPGAASGSPAAAPVGAARSQTDVPTAGELGGMAGEQQEEGQDEGGPGLPEERRARRRAMAQLGGTGRVPPGGSTFLDRDAVIRRQQEGHSV